VHLSKQVEELVVGSAYEEREEDTSAATVSLISGVTKSEYREKFWVSSTIRIEVPISPLSSTQTVKSGISSV
jgi:hypothetical protein